MPTERRNDTARAIALMVLWVVVMTVIGVTLLVPRADAAPPVQWGRTYESGDSLVVPAQWRVPCDELGCATSFRVTWMLPGPAQENGEVQGTVLKDEESFVTAQPGQWFRDSVMVPMGAIGETRQVCVMVVAMRRNLASTGRSACRTIERPDMPPPAIDSIIFDTLNWTRNPLLNDSLVNADTAILTVAPWGYRDTLVEGGWRRDSLSVEYDSTGVPHITVGYRYSPCVITEHVDGTPIVVVRDTALYYAPRQELRRAVGCAARAATLFADRPAVRYWQQAQDFDLKSSDTTVLTIEPFVNEREMERVFGMPRRSGS